MQIQRVNTNRYSSNRFQQPSATTNASQNFGMRLVLDKKFVSQLAKGSNEVESLQKEAILYNMCENLALKDRFKAVFARIYEKNRHDFRSLPEPSQFNPRVIQDWDKLEIEPTFYLDKDGHVVAELTHDKKSGVFAKGTTFIPDHFDGLVEALDHALDDYASKMIYESLWV